MAFINNFSTLSCDFVEKLWNNLLESYVAPPPSWNLHELQNLRCRICFQKYHMTTEFHCVKSVQIRTKNSVFGHFSRSVYSKKLTEDVRFTHLLSDSRLVLSRFLIFAETSEMLNLGISSLGSSIKYVRKIFRKNNIFG